MLLKVKQQVRSDNDASELVILGQFGGNFDEFGTLGEVGGGRTDPLLEMRGRIKNHFSLYLVSGLIVVLLLLL